LAEQQDVGGAIGGEIGRQGPANQLHRGCGRGGVGEGAAQGEEGLVAAAFFF
jgi:hypothetical protein